MLLLYADPFLSKMDYEKSFHRKVLNYCTLHGWRKSDIDPAMMYVLHLKPNSISYILTLFFKFSSIPNLQITDANDYS